ncbi:MAG: 2-amino-4-oxopentanoate thiolase subunit OrtA [Bacillota bacterium]|nr:2-amino-4-oxopentanoate thiolase subunit OrtA [Bacillota bacterium]
MSGKVTAMRGDWVQVHSVVLPAGERAPQVPAETKTVPLEMRVKGFLLTQSAGLGDEVEIQTLAARRLRGRLVAIEPAYGHDFGRPVPELLAIGPEVRALLGQGPAAPGAAAPNAAPPGREEAGRK